MQNDVLAFIAVIAAGLFVGLVFGAAANNLLVGLVAFTIAAIITTLIVTDNNRATGAR